MTSMELGGKMIDLGPTRPIEGVDADDIIEIDIEDVSSSAEPIMAFIAPVRLEILGKTLGGIVFRIKESWGDYPPETVFEARPTGDGGIVFRIGVAFLPRVWRNDLNG